MSIFKKWWFWVILLIIAVGVFGGSSDGADEPEKVGEVSPSPSSSVETPKEPEKTEFGIGDVVELKNVKATMEKVYETSGNQFISPTEGNTYIICEFEIENNSNEQIVVSSLLSFEAYVDDYSTSTSLSAATTVDTPQLDGTVAAGKKLHGVLCYEAPSDWSDIEIRFTPDFWSGKEIIFVYEK